MPAKKPANDKNDDAKQPKAKAENEQPKQPVTDEGAGRHSDTPDSGDTPMAYDSRGDAHALPVEPDHSPEAADAPADPSLHPDAQQPGEAYEDYTRRMADVAQRRPETRG